MDLQERMVADIKAYGLNATNVFSAMIQVPREKFIPIPSRRLAYEDEAVNIGFGQTISQPYTVAFMTDLMDLGGEEKVLEIGTGSGYQAAILSLLANKVYTIEKIPELSRRASTLLQKLGFKNVETRIGSGEFGWKEKAPFDAIMVTAGVEEVPEELFRQLKDGGILVAPVGRGRDKKMTKYVKKGGKIKKEEHGIFNFVPFIESN